jgi:hypothetical protein
MEILGFIAIGILIAGAWYGKQHDKDVMEQQVNGLRDFLKDILHEAERNRSKGLDSIQVKSTTIRRAMSYALSRYKDNPLVNDCFNKKTFIDVIDHGPSEIEKVIFRHTDGLEG